MTSFKGVKRMTSQTDFRRTDIGYKMKMLAQQKKFGRKGEVKFVDDFIEKDLKEKQVRDKNADKYLNDYLNLPSEQQSFFADFYDYKEQRKNKENAEQYERMKQEILNAQNQGNNGNENIE